MTTIRQLVIDAFREGGLVQVGLTPEAEEFEEGLRKLQTLISSLYGNEMGAPLTPVSYGSLGVVNAFGRDQDMADEIGSYYLPANTRLIVNVSSPESVSLQPNPKDGARFAVIDNAHTFSVNNFTIDGNGRRVDGETSLVLDEDGFKGEWFYREDLGEWTRVSDLTPNSQSPFPSKFDDMLSTLLAMRLNPRYQAQTAPETLEELRRLRKLFRAQYKQVTEVRSEEALLRVPSRKDTLYDDFVITNYRFDKGLIW